MDTNNNDNEKNHSLQWSELCKQQLNESRKRNIILGKRRIPTRRNSPKLLDIKSLWGIHTCFCFAFFASGIPFDTLFFHGYIYVLVLVLLFFAKADCILIHNFS